MERKILIIDDDPIFSQISRYHLAAKNFSISIEEKGGDAVQRILTCQPGLIVLDLIMPGKNGFEILEELQQLQISIKTPVAVCSQLAQQPDIDEAMRLGAREYFVKGEDSGKILAAKIAALFP